MGGGACRLLLCVVRQCVYYSAKEVDRLDRERKLEASTLYSSGVRVECPYCHSTNTRKISGASKAGNVALFGVFAAGKVSKQWHCNQCNSDF